MSSVVFRAGLRGPVGEPDGGRGSKRPFHLRGEATRRSQSRVASIRLEGDSRDSHAHGDQQPADGGQAQRPQ